MSKTWHLSVGALAGILAIEGASLVSLSQKVFGVEPVSLTDQNPTQEVYVSQLSVPNTVENSVEMPKEKETVKKLEKSYRTNNLANDSEEVLLARMLFGEARGCTDLEKVAIGYTAVNRAEDGKRWNGETVKEAILTKAQYTSMNPGDVNYKKVMDPEKYDKNEFRNCLDLANKILDGEIADPINATHFYNPDVVGKPSWASKITYLGRLDTSKGKSEHVFYREN